MGTIVNPAGVRVSQPFATARRRPRTIRRGFEIHGYTGSNGGGKSLAAVYDTLPTLAAGRPVVSTVRLLDPATLEPHPLYVPLDDFRTLLEVERCDVIMDEVTGVASARDAMSMPSAVLNHLMQLRRRDVSLRWTTPNWRRADTGIREVTRAITTCLGLIPEAAPSFDDGIDRLWRSRRLFVWRTYDAKNFDEWSTAKERGNKSAQVRPVARQFLWRPGSIAGCAYDTFDAVLSLGAVSDAGMCLDCGGRRTARRCGCSADGTGPAPDPSPGALVWRKNFARPDAADPGPSPVPVDGLDGILTIPETDDTPGVALPVHVG